MIAFGAALLAAHPQLEGTESERVAWREPGGLGRW